MPIIGAEGGGFALALDGGGTGCRAALVDPAGQVIGRGLGGPANVNSDRDGALASVRQACDLALAGRVDPARVSAVLGLAGAEVSRADGWLTSQLSFGRLRVVQDATIAMMGALGGGDGIVAAIGTGSVFSRRFQGADLIIGGRGPILGDQASGNWLGRQLLAHALEAADGLRDLTPLLAQVLDQMGGTGGIVTFASIAQAPDFAAHAPQVFDHTDDPAAQEILRQAVSAIIAFVRRLQPDDTALPVVFTGGLGAGFAARMAGHCPVVQPKGSPLDGALLMARELAQG